MCTGNPSSLSRCVCVRMCMYVCVHVCVCTRAHTWVCLPMLPMCVDIGVFHSCSPCFLETGSLIEPEARCFGCAVCQTAPAIHLPLSPVLELHTCTSESTPILHVCWGFKLTSMCLPSGHLIHRAFSFLQFPKVFYDMPKTIRN